MTPRLSRILILVILLFLLTFEVDSIPGIHGDEAWSLLRSWEIGHGLRPFTGINSYTGSVFQYLLAPIFQILGYSVQVLRWTSAVLNMATLALIMATMDALSDKATQVGTRVGALIATLPIFVILSRFSIELTAITPLLVAAALYLMVSFDRQRVSTYSGIFSGILAGFLFALACYNHIVTLCFIASLGLSALLTWKMQAFRSHRFRITLISFFFFYIPFLILAMQQTETNGPATAHHFQGLIQNLKSLKFVSDLFELPRVIVGLWDGSLLYRRFTGENFVPVLPYATFLIVFVLFWPFLFWLTRKVKPLFASYPLRKDSITHFLGLVLIIHFILVSIAVPYLSERWFELNFLLGICLLAWMTEPLFMAPRNTTRFYFATVGHLLFIGLNIFYLSLNYFYAFSQSKGRLAVFSMGIRSLETSNHFIDKTALQEQLELNQIQTVATDNLTGWALLADPLIYLKPRYRVIGFRDPDLLPPSSEFHGKSAIVFMNGLNPIGTATVVPPNTDAIHFVTGETFRLAKGYDRKFLVYEATFKK